MGAVARWTGRNFPLFGLIGLAVVALGSAIFWPPYRLVGAVEGRAKPLHDVRSTYKLVSGIVLFTLWWALLVVLTGWWLGWGAAGAVAIALPLLGALTLDLQERWSTALQDAWSFWIHLSRPAPVAELSARQRRLAERLSDLHRDGGAPSDPPATPDRAVAGILPPT